MTPISHFDLLAHYWANFSPVFSSKMLRAGLIFFAVPRPPLVFPGTSMWPTMRGSMLRPSPADHPLVSTGTSSVQ